MEDNNKSITLNKEESNSFFENGHKLTRIENEKEAIIEAFRQSLMGFDDYRDIREEASYNENDFSLSVSVKIPDGFNKIILKITGSVKKTSEATVYFDDDGQMQLDFDNTESVASEIERNSRR